MTVSEPVTPRLREMRWWDIDPVLELERDLFPEDAWSRGMFWSELAHARGPEATRRYVVRCQAYRRTLEGAPFLGCPLLSASRSTPA